MITDAMLPVIFVALLGLAVLIYAILDGYDLGVGMLLPLEEGSTSERDQLIASIGPFWDANETWLVLAVGILLIAFPVAHSEILYELYLPVSLMILGLILRGVAFDFRTKASVDLQPLWDKCFKYGSLLTALTQGYMLGQYIVGFNHSLEATLFCVLSAFGVSAAYCYIGAGWLVMKMHGELQIKAVAWAKQAGRIAFIGVCLVSITNPLINPGVFDRWFDYPLVMFVLLIPLLCFSAFITNEILLRKMPLNNDSYCAVPFLICVSIFLLCFTGLAFSYFPYIVPDKVTIWQAASAPESLRFILVGALIVVPTILAYTVYSYRVFHGKASDLKYY